MEFKKYVRKPFRIEAIEITEENLAELAVFIGTLGETPDGTRYIQVDRTLIPSIDRVYAGFFLTKLGNNRRCYSKRVFKEQFLETDDSVEKWIEYINRKQASSGDESEGTSGAEVAGV